MEKADHQGLHAGHRDQNLSSHEPNSNFMSHDKKHVFNTAHGISIVDVYADVKGDVINCK